MTIKASGCSLLIVATGLIVCCAGPSPALANADDAVAGANATNSAPASVETASPGSGSAAAEPSTVKNNVKQGPPQLKKQALRKPGRLALKASTAKKAHAADVAPDDGTSTAIPPSVAEANARMSYADTPAGRARAMSAWANRLLQTGSDDSADARPTTETEVVSPDQLNDVDRMLPPSAPPAPRMRMASADPPAEPATAGSDESSPWDKASMIGKIFMGFGGLLTLASAVRMFMA
jgi:hypothetical protein